VKYQVHDTKATPPAAGTAMGPSQRIIKKMLLAVHRLGHHTLLTLDMAPSVPLAPAGRDRQTTPSLATITTWSDAATHRPNSNRFGDADWGAAACTAGSRINNSYCSCALCNGK